MAALAKPPTKTDPRLTSLAHPIASAACGPAPTATPTLTIPSYVMCFHISMPLLMLSPRPGIPPPPSLCEMLIKRYLRQEPSQRQSFSSLPAPSATLTLNSVLCSLLACTSFLTRLDTPQEQGVDLICLCICP